MNHYNFTSAARVFNFIDDEDWARERFKLKFFDNFGREPRRDLFELPANEFGLDILFNEAEDAGLSPYSRLILDDLTAPSATFLEFAQKMQSLEELASADGELGYTAAYLYALCCYNIPVKIYWHQYQSLRDVPERNIMTEAYQHIADNTKNPELKRRAKYMLEVPEDPALSNTFFAFAINFHNPAEQCLP